LFVALDDDDETSKTELTEGDGSEENRVEFKEEEEVSYLYNALLKSL